MRPSVLVAFADTGGEAGAIRAAAEWFGANVYYFPVGRPADFLAVLASSDAGYVNSFFFEIMCYLCSGLVRRSF